MLSLRNHLSVLLNWNDHSLSFHSIKQCGNSEDPRHHTLHLAGTTPMSRPFLVTKGEVTQKLAGSMIESCYKNRSYPWKRHPASHKHFTCKFYVIHLQKKFMERWQEKLKLYASWGIGIQQQRGCLFSTGLQSELLNPSWETHRPSHGQREDTPLS